MQSQFEKTLAELCAGNLIACERLLWILNDRAYPEILQIKKFAEQLKYGTKQCEKANAHLTKESQAGNLFASAFLGYMYVAGLGSKKSKSNAEKGLELINKSVKGDNPLGHYFLGKCYRDGIEEIKNFASDFAIARGAFEKGVAKNCPCCLVGLAQMYEEGQGLQRSLADANKIYEQAARLGSPIAILKFTQRGPTPRNANPFMHFAPSNLDFTYELAIEKNAYVSGDTGKYGYIMTKQQTDSITIRVAYTGQVNIGQAFELDRKIGPEMCQWDAIVKTHALVIPAGFSNEEAGKLMNYIFSREISKVICDAQSLIKDLVEKAQSRRTSAAAPIAAQPVAAQAFPGAFFNPPPQQQPLPVYSQPRPVDPAVMGQIVQTLYQNPMFAAEVAELHRRYQQNSAPQPNSNNYSQAPHNPNQYK